MKLEYFAYEPLITNEEYQESIFWATEHKFDVISIPLYNLTKLKDFIVGPKTAVAVDFPYGNSISTLKLHAIIDASRKGINIVDVVLNNNMIINGLQHELSKEINTYLQACKTNKVDIRVILDYTIFNEEQLAEVCYMIAKAGITTVITNTGRFTDDITENILVSRKIRKNIGLNCIITAYHINKETFETAKKAGIYGLRFLSMNTAKNVLT